MHTFPWVTLGIGLLLALVLLQFSPLNAGDRFSMPLLTALLMSEFGFLATAVGAVISGREMLRAGVQLRSVTLMIGNLLLAANFIRLGLALWPEVNG